MRKIVVEKAVILDVDGLMVDTEPLSRLAWDKVLARFGCVLDDDLYTQMIGYRIDESVSMVIDAFDLPLSSQEVIELKRIEYDQVLADGVPAMPGLYELIQAIDAQSIPWAVATSSPHAHAKRILRQLGLAGSCAAIAGGDEVSQAKPAPEIYLLVAQRLAVPPTHCLAVEDSAPGCRAALAAGMMTLAVPNGDTRGGNFPPVHKVFKSLFEVADQLELLLNRLPNT